MDINYYLQELYDKIRWGDIVYKGRTGNSYYLCSDKQEVCYSILLESISVAEFNNNGKKWILYLDKSNLNHSEFDEYLFNSIFEIIIEIIATEKEVDRLESEMRSNVLSENFETASKYRDVINNIKLILNKL